MDPILPDLSDRVKRTGPRQAKRGKRVQLTVSFFDLAGSTFRKLDLGHIEGVRAALQHNAACRVIGRRFGGRAIKDLGDGVLMVFPDSLKAVLAAINLKRGLEKYAGLSTKVGITSGLVEKVRIGSRDDVLGSTVDRCARLEALAQPGQIIIDRPLFEAVRSFLKDYENVGVSDPMTQILPGVGETEVREVFAGRARPIPLGAFKGAFWLNESGRLPLAEKARFLEGARDEVIEIGVGLTTFADYFHAFDRTLFKEPVRKLLQRSVVFRCVAVNPNSQAAKVYSGDRGEPPYLREVKESIRKLREVRDEFRRDRLRGSLEMYTYARIPYYHAMCVDIGEGKPSPNGRMVVSNYLFATKRADCPVMRFSAKSNPRLFETYWHSVRAMLRESRRAW